MFKADILLSTYNGEEFLREQLDSLLKQTFQGWCLIVRDDGSSDHTCEIVKSYANQYPGKISFIDDGQKRIGACRSFAALLEHSSADYVMFCDQDDVWLEGKVEATLAKMKELEVTYPGKPILIHTDLKVTDEKLNVISDSMWIYQKLDPERKSLNYLLVQNNVTGCTVMINKKLRELILPLHNEIIVHDWWLALAASAFGKIGYVNMPAILYRQHGRNDVGAKKYSVEYFLLRFRRRIKAAELFDRVMNQADALLRVYQENLDEGKREMVECFSTLGRQGRFKRIYSIFKHKFTKSGILRNIGYLGFLFLLSNKER